MQWLKKIVVFVALIWMSSPVLSADIKCEQAKTNVEAKICANPLILSLNRELSVAYKQLRRQVKEQRKADIEAEQRYWQKSVRDACTDEACLLRAYAQRLSAFMPSACRQKDEHLGRVNEAIANTDYEDGRICTRLEYVISEEQVNEVIVSFNNALATLGDGNRITSCDRILQVDQVTLSGTSRNYQSYGAVCRIGNQTVEVCDYPLVGKFTMKLGGYSGQTLELARFIMNNCPLGG